MIKYLAQIAPVLLLASGAAPAQSANQDATHDSRYSYAQLAWVPYQHFDTDEGGDDADGFSAALSWHFLYSVYAFGRGDFTNLDDSNTDYDAYSLGIGFRDHLGDTRPDLDTAGQVDIYSEFSYENLKLSETERYEGETARAKIKGDGFGITVGLRWLATSALEFNPYAGYVNYGDPDVSASEGGYTVHGRTGDTLDGARYGLRAVADLGYDLAAIAAFERTQLSVAGEDIDENTARLGVRWYFPSRGLAMR